MKLTANFTLDELVKSQTAVRKDINNMPNPDQIENLKALAANILQPVRSHFDKPLIISSGFRCAELCIAIGSSINSQHAKGEASDFEIWGTSNEELAKWIKSELEYDQLILEFWSEENPNSGWVHCSYSRDHNRNASLVASKNEAGKTQYRPWL